MVIPTPASLRLSRETRSTEVRGHHGGVPELERLNRTEATPSTLTHRLFLACLQGDRVPEKRDCPASGPGRVGASKEGGNGQASGQGRAWVP